MLEVLDQWLEPHHQAVWAGIYLHNESHSREALTDAYRLLDASSFPDDERNALTIYLNFLGHQADFYFRQPPESDGAEILQRAASLLSIPQHQPVSSSMQSRVLLTICCFAHARGALTLAETDAALWLSRVAESDMDHQTWNYISFWAFAIRDTEYLTRAYRYYLTRPVDFMVDFSRQRIKVLISLTEGRCMIGDIERMINLMPNPLHTDWFRWFLQPACIQQGLWTEGLALALSRREAEVGLNRSIPPSTAPRDRLRGNI